MFVMDSTEVKDSYQGARLVDDNLTLEFVQKMMDDFKQQRSIHTRYLDAVTNIQPQFEILEIVLHVYIESRICCLLQFFWTVSLVEFFHTQYLYCFIIVFCRYAFQILMQTREILLATPTLVDITVPDKGHFTVCGDIHGQVQQEFILESKMLRGVC